MSHSMCPSMPISMRYPHEEGYCLRKSLNMSYFSQLNKFIPWKISFSIFFGLYVTTTFPYNLHKIIDPIDLPSHPQGVPQFQAQYIKLTTSASIAILIIFTYMVANEVLWNIFWVEDISRPLRPKNWPKKGQNFRKRKIFYFSH